MNLKTITKFHILKPVSHNIRVFHGDLYKKIIFSLRKKVTKLPLIEDERMDEDKRFEKEIQESLDILGEKIKQSNSNYNKKEALSAYKKAKKLLQ